MHRTLLAVAAALVLGLLAGAHLARATPGDAAFVLEAQDRLIAEAPGCYVSCQGIGTARSCTVRESECHAVCSTLPECKPDGAHPVRVCAVVRDVR